MIDPPILPAISQIGALLEEQQLLKERHRHRYLTNYCSKADCDWRLVENTSAERGSAALRHALAAGSARRSHPAAKDVPNSGRATMNLVKCLVGALAFLAPIRARAQHEGSWSITSLVPTCSITGQYVGPMGGLTARQVDGLDRPGAKYDFFGANYPMWLPVSADYSDDLELTGSEAVKLAWTGTPPAGGIPPAVIAVRPYAWFGLQYNQNDVAPATVEGTLSDGYNDSVERFHSAPFNGSLAQQMIMGTMEYYEPSPSGNVNLTTTQNRQFMLPYPPGRSVYLIPLQGSDGTANYTTPTLRVDGQAYEGNVQNIQTEFLLCGLRCGIRVDNRWLQPISPITTYFTGTYRNDRILSHKAMVNVLDADVGDPENVQTLPISVLAEGNWSPNTPYKWYDGATGASGSGVISNGIISFNDNIASVKAGTTDHIYVAAYDAVDNAKASADIYVTFHPMYDNWTVRNIVEHPGSFQDTGKPVTVNYYRYSDADFRGGWKFLCYCDRTGRTSSFQAAPTLAETDSGAISASTDLRDVNLAFKTNENFTIGQTVHFAPFQKVSSMPYSAAAFYLGVTSTDQSGVCAEWGPHGFVRFDTYQSTYFTGVLSSALDPTNP